jgi:choline-sulfatase
MNVPNIVFLHVDQMDPNAIAAYGQNRDVYTPCMDRLAKQGHSFMKSYTTSPLCAPARTSWFTGRMPLEHGCIRNNFCASPDIPDLGQWLSSQGGYECFLIGKWHVNGRPQAKSFKVLSQPEAPLASDMFLGDSYQTQSAVSFLQNYTGSKPFFLTIGLLNPHDCQGYSLRSGLVLLAERIKDQLPELPKNFNYDYRRNPVASDQKAGIRTMHDWYDDWTLQDWQYYRYEYHRMVEMVDSEIGRIWDALQSSPFAENTLVIFTADHGEGATHHATITKGLLYDESWRVPAIAVWPGHIQGNLQDHSHLMSGVDIPATICDYAEVAMLPKMTVGKSLRPVLENKKTEWRDYVVGETLNFERGTAIRDVRYKTTFFIDGAVRVFDMDRDPGETEDISTQDIGKEVTKNHWKHLRDYIHQIEPYHGRTVAFRKSAYIKCTAEEREQEALQLAGYLQWYTNIASGEVDYAQT